MKEKFKISIVVPIYNEEKYLDECIFSITNQTYRNLEIILVDDGSTSSCAKKCDSYCLKDSRIRVFHKKNEGLFKARRDGINIATGEYIGFVDADDWIEKDFYKEMVKMMEKAPDIITSSNYYRDYSNGVSEVFDNKRTGYWEKDEFESEVLPYFIKTTDFFDTEFPASMCVFLFKAQMIRKVINKINKDLKMSEDCVVVIMSLLSANSFAVTPYRGYHYRYNIESMCHYTKNVKEALKEAYEAIDGEIEKSIYDQRNLQKKNDFVLFHNLMHTAYHEVLKLSDDFLFPYSNVRKGSKIIIYGAGTTGKQMYKAIQGNNEYEIKAIADKNWKSYKDGELTVIAPEDILQYDFDYIVIAILYANVRKQVKQSLVELGIEIDKIAEPDIEVLKGGREFLGID